MKRFKYIIFFLTIAMFLSCEKFLTYQDKDKIIPTELKHFEELIYGEVLKKDIKDNFYKLEFMTDDVSDFVGQYTSSSSTDTRTRLWSWYTWAKDPQVTKTGDEEFDELWDFLYNKILMTNIIEEKVNEFAESGLKFRLLGEVQFMRALSYFFLVNTYGVPYESFEQSKTALGVPVNAETSIRNYKYSRQTLRTVYDLIEKDLISAGDNLAKGDGKVSKFRPNVDAVKLFLSRTHLFQKNYDEVIKVSSELISESKTSIETLENMKNYESGSPLLYNSNNPSILFTWGDAVGQGPFGSGYYENLRYTSSSNLLNMYVAEDIRRKAFFDPYYSRPLKNICYTEPYYNICYRIEEAYMNRAEAYAEKGNFEAALSDINHIRKERVALADYKKTTNDKSELIEIVRNERRMEFCFEFLRWFDIRRWGLEIYHKFLNRNDVVQYELYTLKKNSPNYTLPLPLMEQRLNDVIQKFDRVDCKVSNQ